MNIKKSAILLSVIFSFLLAGCFYPATYVYFEPSSAEGTAYDGGPHGRLTNSHNAFKIEVNETQITIQSYQWKDNKLHLTIVITPRSNDIDFNMKLFTVKDMVSGKKYLPIRKNVTSSQRRRYIKESFWETETVYTHWIHLTYDINLDSLTHFQFIFPKGALKMNSKDMKLLPIDFKKKKVNTIKSITINS